jgi:bifunctional ADP-heptose synthase (sugar kinase/adenylyltransferase)
MGVGSNGTLPVSWISFTANANGMDAVLNWATATETNNKGFEVERSLDGSIFKTIGFVEGRINSGSVKNYRFTDNRALEMFAGASVYYRLKQVDLDWFKRKYNNNFILFNGTWDVLSVAHLRNFEMLKRDLYLKNYTNLICVNDDESYNSLKSNLVNSIDIRVEQISKLYGVDYVTAFNKKRIHEWLIENDLKPHTWCKGYYNYYTKKEIEETELKWFTENNIEIKFINNLLDIHTSELKEKLK